MEKKHKNIITLIVLLFGIFIIIFSAQTKEVRSTSTNQGYRVGAICNDGWRSHSTGSGTCSGHGGVDYWLYSNSTTSTTTKEEGPSVGGIVFGSLVSLGAISYGIYLNKED